MALKNIINELVVGDILQSIKFYEDILGFKIEYTDGNPICWVEMNKDNQQIMLEEYKKVKKEISNYPTKSNSSNIIKFEFDNKNEFDEIYNNCQTNSCDLFLKYHTTDYGKIEFGIYDPDKNIIIMSYIKQITS